MIFAVIPSVLIWREGLGAPNNAANKEVKWLTGGNDAVLPPSLKRQCRRGNERNKTDQNPS